MNSLVRKLGQTFVCVHSSFRLFVLTHKDSSKTQNLPGGCEADQKSVGVPPPPNHAKGLKKNAHTLYV